MGSPLRRPCRTERGTGRSNKSSMQQRTLSWRGANTGRFTCSNPNFQNIPRDEAIRSLIQAATGCKLVSADYSQVELRILAMTANESVMLKAYEDGKDLHRLTASNVSGIPFDEVTGEQRRAAKAINFGLVFGMGAKGLAEYARATYGVNQIITPL
jgi:DNA polymerase I